jgi:hypothetical protein
MGVIFHFKSGRESKWLGPCLLYGALFGLWTPAWIMGPCLDYGALLGLWGPAWDMDPAWIMGLCLIMGRCLDYAAITDSGSQTRVDGLVRVA